MSGWSGGVANRTWQRDARGPDSGRIGLVDEVCEILAAFRAAHGWQPGMVWDPFDPGSACDPDCRARRGGKGHGAYKMPAPKE